MKCLDVKDVLLLLFDSRNDSFVSKQTNKEEKYFANEDQQKSD
jgi:hypothetical protein